MKPPDYNGHDLQTTKNLAIETDDGRLRIHYAIFCDRCRQTEITRGRFPTGLRDKKRAAVLSKLAAISKFDEPCDRNT